MLLIIRQPYGDVNARYDDESGEIPVSHSFVIFIRRNERQTESKEPWEEADESSEEAEPPN